MTIQKRWIQRGVLWGMVLGGLVACVMIASPPGDLIAKNDHAGLIGWYEKEATHLRQHATDMKVMAEEYRKNPGPSTRAGLSPKIDLLQHCESLVAVYTKAAEEADLLAQGHRDMLK